MPRRSSHWPAGVAHAADWRRLAGAWVSPRHTLAPNGAPRAPAGQSSSHLVFDAGTRPTLYLLELQLIPQTRSRGLGAFLVHALEELARAHRSMSRARAAAQSRPDQSRPDQSHPEPACASQNQPWRAPRAASMGGSRARPCVQVKHLLTCVVVNLLTLQAAHVVCDADRLQGERHLEP